MPELKWNCSAQNDRKHKILIGEIAIGGKVIRDITLLLTDEELAKLEAESEECGVNLDAYLKLVTMSRFGDQLKRG